MTKILVVDDDAEIRELLHDLLTDEGFRVNVASDGREALDILKREGGWVILLDLMMPRMTGQEVVERLKKDSTLLQDNKVVLMSAGWRLAREGHALKSDVVVAVLPKPFEIDEVLTLLKGISS